MDKVEQFIGSHGSADINSYVNNARQLVKEGWPSAKFHPPSIEGQPCEVVSRLAFFRPTEVEGTGMGVH